MRAVVKASLGAALALGAPAYAQVPVDRLELSGAIAGRVCRDLGGDGRCDEGDPGVPGARVLLETGDVALADAEGRFHFSVVSARGADDVGGGRLQTGRHRVSLDARGLAPGEKLAVKARTVEVPMAGLATVEFAIVPAPRSSSEVRLAPEEQAPAGVLMSSSASSDSKTGSGPAQTRVRFLLAGQATPGDHVTVQGRPAQLDARGVYRAWVELSPGANDVPIAAQTPSGAVRFFTQRVDVVERRGGVLVIPRALQPTASMQLPGGEGQAASTGHTSIHVESAPGTRIVHPGGELTVGASGVAEVPVELRSGNNQVAMRIERPGQPARDQQLDIPAAPRPLFSGLVDLEATYSPQEGRFRLMGRGGAHGEYRVGPWELAGELELRDTDFTRETTGARFAQLLLPRAPERLDRAIDPDRAPITWGDDAVELSSNPAEGRLRLELRHDGLGRVGFGTYRAQLMDAEVGRFHRLLFGPYVELDAPLGKEGKDGKLGSVGASGFFTPGAADPTRPLSTSPAHDELRATGGSLFYLSHAAVSEGSEHVTVELRDGRTGLPLSERHLVRGRDYEIDYVQGRLLLARPLSFLEGTDVLGASPLQAFPEPVLVVDYARLELGPSPTQTAGGELRAALGPVQLGLGVVDARVRGADPFQLFRGTAKVTFGLFGVSAEAALSRGAALGGEGPALSDDGGLSFQRAATPVTGGTALGLRVRGPGLTADGVLDAAVRYRSAGFSDDAHLDLVDHRQLSLRARQPIGPVRVGALIDFQQAADPRFPYAAIPFGARRLGVSAAYQLGPLEVGVDGEDAELTAVVSEADTTELTGGRLAAGAYARYRVLPWLGLEAGHRQVLATRGDGPGAFNDTFTHAGADLTVERWGTLGARVGYGPALGPLAWAQAEHRAGNDAYYGSYSVDVDGPDHGAARAVSGARTVIGQGASVFVEDVAAHDASAVRVARAVGFSQAGPGGLELSVRFERGARHPLGLDDTLTRDAGGVSAAWIHDRFRLYARAEGRRETGLAIGVGERLQGVLSGAAELELARSLRFGGRINWAHTQRGGFLEARLLEGTAALAWRTDPAMVVLRYALRRELSPATRSSVGERTFHTVSLLPALRLGDRVTLSSGGHVGWNSEDGNRSLVLSGSLRPSVRVVGGLELAAEVAARTVSPEGGEWAALRGEAGYRFDDRMMLAVGYTFFGFSGLGLGDGADGRRDRLYVRAELAY